MKKWGPLLAAGIVGVCMILSGCSRLSQISGSQFIRQVVARPVDSTRSNRYIGASATRAYLEHWSAIRLFGAQTTVQWTPLTELPPGVVQEIRSGKNPWPNLWPATQPAGIQATESR